MIKVKISNINFGERELELKHGIISEIFSELKVPDDGVIITDDNGNIYTRDRKIKNDAHLNLIEVFSGG